MGLWLVLGLLCLNPAVAEEAAAGKEPAENPLAELSEGREELKLPGIRVLIKERYVDVDSKVCLDSGMLELIACTKDSKEHESLIAIDAKAAHVHAALLLIGARPGNPATSKRVDGEQVRWIHVPPRGQNIDVFLVLENKEGVPTEYPISHFLTRAEEHEVYTTEEDEEKPKEFPTNTFLFAGSHVFKDGESEPVYLSDESGNVISIATFGDELLCLPGFHEHGNEGLVWEIDSEKLPPLGTKVILRLKPQFANAGPPEEKKTNDTKD
jgi:hypothetical protein